MRSFSRLFQGLLIAVSLPVAAQQGPSPEVLFKRLDKNGDGFISVDELPEERRANLKNIDRDGDGKISLQEHLAIFARRGPGPEARPESKGRSQASQAAIPDTVDAQLNVPYADNKNPRQMLDLFLPKKRNSDKPLPVVVFIHGGGWKGGDKSAGVRSVMPYVTSGDYAGASIGYRLTNEAQWPAQIQDCKAAIRWLRGNAEKFGLDKDHIAVWGSSAGGHLVSMLGTSGDVGVLEGRLGKFTDQSSRVQAVVNYYGPENFITMVTQPSTIDRTQQGYPEALLIGGRVQDVPDAAKGASPVTYISKDDPPFLTVHGTKDPLVPFAQAEELHAGLKKAGVSSVLITMQGGGHGFASRELEDIVHRFLDKQLRGVEGKVQDATIEVEPAKGQPLLEPAKK